MKRFRDRFRAAALKKARKALGPALIAACIAACIAASCGLPFGSMPVAVELPPFPEAWAEASTWELSWSWAGGGAGPVAAAPGELVELRLPRGAEAALLCSARIGEGLTLPYGASWPQDLGDGGVLRPSAAGGWAAQAAALLYRSGLRESGLDLPRLARESSERMADPWDLNPAAVLPAALQGRLRADHLKAPASVELRMDLSAVGGAMASDSPWGLPAAPDSGGEATVRVAMGSYRRWMGGGWELSAWVPAEGEPGEPAWILVGPGGAGPSVRSRPALAGPEP